MFIFNSFSVGFTSFCHSVAFILRIFPFVSETGQRGKNETKSNVNKNMTTYLLCLKKGLSSVDKKITQK